MFLGERTNPPTAKKKMTHVISESIINIPKLLRHTVGGQG